MAHYTCMECRSRFESPAGKQPACPVCGTGTELRLDDPRAGRAPTQVRALAVGDAVFAGLLALVAILAVAVAATPDAQAWQDLGLGDELPPSLNPDHEREPLPGAGVTGWSEGVLYGTGAGLGFLFLLHAIVLGKYMAERNWARILRVVLAVGWALGLVWVTYWMFRFGEGPLGAGLSVVLVALAGLLNLFALFALNQGGTWDWFHPDAGPDRR